ncbi:MAG: hypothetical protein ACI8QC_002438 [Planctomycetota bacterium]|jgi:hypothetical protein
MTNSNPIVCFQCGCNVQDPPVLNQEAEGKNCRPCADRVLDFQPGLLPEDIKEALRPNLVLLKGQEADIDDDWRPEPA